MLKWALCVVLGWPTLVGAVYALLNGDADGWVWARLGLGVFLTASGGAGLVLGWLESRRRKPLPVYPPLRGHYPPPDGPPSMGPITANNGGWAMIGWALCFLVGWGLLVPAVFVLIDEDIDVGLWLRLAFGVVLTVAGGTGLGLGARALYRRNPIPSYPEEPDER